MPEAEGVIKFKLRYRASLAPLLFVSIQEIGHWRQEMVVAGLIGQDPERYDGYGFGNLSCRLPPYQAPPNERAFLITGTQTGHKSALSVSDYAVVRGCYAEENMVIAEGPTKPSSESITHGTVYALSASLHWVFHVHSPELWQAAAELGIPITHPDIAYGTPAMAKEVERLFSETTVRKQRVFAMGGHEDGLVAFGKTAQEAGGALFDLLSKTRITPT